MTQGPTQIFDQNARKLKIKPTIISERRDCGSSPARASSPQAEPLVGIDKESKSISFFCCSLYTDELGVFMQKKYNVCLSVCASSTICVCKPQKWYEHFVRGTIGTENSLNTHISRLCAEAVTNT
jgi:hypothetical protein